MLLALFCAPVAADSGENPDPKAPEQNAEEASGPLQEMSLDELRSFSDALTIIRRHYVDEKSLSELLDAALAGIAYSLDSHTTILGPEAFQRQDQDTRGRQAGVGMELEVNADRRIVVREVFPDGPAWLAGVRAGDLLMAVDGQRVRGRPLRESMAEVFGPPGTSVTLRLKRGDLGARNVTLERALVPVPSVRATLVDGTVGHFSVSRFHLGTAAEFERRFEALQLEAGGADFEGIVLDLRDNLGGAIKPAAQIADGFLDEGLVVYTRGRYPASHIEYHAMPGQLAPETPVTVLVNGSSASASEILAGALQDHGRATIVGTTTYGKGTVQSVLRMRDGSGLRLTTARYYTPAGRSFDGQGIAPDVTVEASAQAAPGKEPVAASEAGNPKKVEDPFLARALEVLREDRDGARVEVRDDNPQE